MHHTITKYPDGFVYAEIPDSITKETVFRINGPEELWHLNQFVIQCYTDQYIAEIYNVFKFSQLQLDDNGELELVFLN